MILRAGQQNSLEGRVKGCWLRAEQITKQLYKPRDDKTWVDPSQPMRAKEIVRKMDQSKIEDRAYVSTIGWVLK